MSNPQNSSRGQKMTGGGQTGTNQKLIFNSNLNGQGQAYIEEATNVATGSIMTSLSNTK